MDTSPTPFSPPPAHALADRRGASGTEEEVPLGWECANPALQIERWVLEKPDSGAKVLSSKS